MPSFLEKPFKKSTKGLPGKLNRQGLNIPMAWSILVNGGRKTGLTTIFADRIVVILSLEFHPPGKPSVPFFKATVAVFRGKVDGN